VGAPQYEDGEMCWHESGGDVPWWAFVGWAVVIGIVAGGLIILSMGVK
jgi:hypothetical protein